MARRLFMAMIVVAMAPFPAFAQQTRIDRQTGNYVDVPDRFSQDWPQPDLSTPSPYSVVTSVTRRVSNSTGGSTPPTHAVTNVGTSANQSADLQSMGGMSMYNPNAGTFSANVYPDWWPK